MKEKAEWFFIGVLVALAIVFLVGATNSTEPQVGRYQIAAEDTEHERFIIFDTATGAAFRVWMDGSRIAGGIDNRETMTRQWVDEAFARLNE